MVSTSYAGCNDYPSKGVDWQRCYNSGEDFSNQDLSDANLRETRFIRSNLFGTNLYKASGFKAKFVNSNLKKTIFDESTFQEFV